jgi:hypothetical protein
MDHISVQCRGILNVRGLIISGARVKIMVALSNKMIYYSLGISVVQCEPKQCSAKWLHIRTQGPKVFVI